MPCAGQQTDCHIFHPGFYHASINRLYAFSSITDRIVLPGNQQNRHYSIPSFVSIGLACALNGAKQFPEQAGGNVLSHKGVCQVFIQLLLIGAKPVGNCTIGLELLIISAKGQLPHQICGVIKASLFDLPFHNPAFSSGRPSPQPRQSPPGSQYPANR